MTLIISTWEKGKKDATFTYPELKTICLVTPTCINVVEKNNKITTIPIDFESMDITIVE